MSGGLLSHFVMRGNLDDLLSIVMVFHGLDRQQVDAIWRPFFDWVRSTPQEYEFVSAPQVLATSGRRFWDPATLRQVPGLVVPDDPEGAPEGNVFWAVNQVEAGQVMHGLQSVWLPASLLEPDQRERLVEALVAATKHWRVALQFNKGLAGGRPEAIAAARETAVGKSLIRVFVTLRACARPL